MFRSGIWQIVGVLLFIIGCTPKAEIATSSEALSATRQSLATLPTFVVTSAASALPYSDTNRPFGVNTYLAIYPSAGYKFNTKNGGTYYATAETMAKCKPNDQGSWVFADCALGGIVIFQRFEATFTPLGTITYASPTQINFVLPQTPNLSGRTTGLILFEEDPVDPRAFTSEAVSTPEWMNFEHNNAQPFLVYTKLGGAEGGFINGSLYGFSKDSQGGRGAAVYLKPLVDGKANPRSYNGFPTVPQVYVTGVGRVAASFPLDHLRFQYDDRSRPGEIGSQTMYEQIVGVYVTNLEPTGVGGTWGEAGVHEVRLGYGNAIVWSQQSVAPGKIWFE